MTSKSRSTDVDATSLHRIDVSTTPFRRFVPAGYKLLLEGVAYGC